MTLTAQSTEHDVAGDPAALVRLAELRTLCEPRPSHAEFLEAAMTAPLSSGPRRPPRMSQQAASALLTDVDWIRGWRPPDEFPGAYAAWKADRDAAAARSAAVRARGTAATS